MDEFDSEQKRYWSERALNFLNPLFVSIADPVQKEIEIRFIDSLNLIFGNVLEIGCGNGVMTKYFGTNADQVTAIDISHEMIERAKADNTDLTNAIFEFGDATKLEFENQTFDTVVLVRVLINMPTRENQIKAIKEAHRVLKTEGHLILIEGKIESFDYLNLHRNKKGLADITPSKINLYLDNDFFLTYMSQHFEHLVEINSGLYDFLTRVLFPGTDDTNFQFTLSELKNTLRLHLDFVSDLHMQKMCSRLVGGLFKKISSI